MADDIVQGGKVCTACKIWNPYSNFNILKTGVGGRTCWCKPCFNKKAKERYAANRQVFLDRSAKNRTENPEKTAAIKERSRQKKLEYYHARAREYYAQNRESIREKQAEYRCANRDRINESNRRYGAANRAKLSIKDREYRNSTPLRSLAANVRSRVNIAIRNGGYTKQARKTSDIVGCDWENLKAHIERQFKRGMSWENRSKWHLDHIIPLSSASNEDDLLRLCHFTNLRPIWAKENMRKHSKRMLLI